MPERRFRVLVVVSHPIQYAVPVFRLLAQYPQIDFQVAYCTLRGAEAAYDPEFGRDVQWDVPLLNGYKWTHVPNQGSGGESFFGLYNPGLWKLIRGGRFDSVLCSLGYMKFSFWICYLAARIGGAPFMFMTDATSIAALDGKKWKTWIKKLAWPVLFRTFSQVLPGSNAGVALMHSVGMPAPKITMAPFTVDNDWWQAQSAVVNRDAVRASWGLDNEEKVVLFCAKLQPWKRPLDLLRAFAAVEIPHSTLLFAGDGPLRANIEAEAAALGLDKRVRMLGFVNQSQLPAVYRASDVMVIPSEYDAFGLVVNEAMLSGCVVIASDKVGAVRDLISPGRTGYVYPCGDTRALAAALREAFAEPARLAAIAQAAGDRISSWSPRATADAMVGAVVRVVTGSAQAPRLANAADHAFDADRSIPS